MWLQATRYAFLAITACVAIAPAHGTTSPIQDNESWTPVDLAVPLTSIHPALEVGAKRSSNQPSPRLKMFVVHRKGSHKGYSVEVRYPQFTGVPNSLISKLNKKIQQLVDINVPARRGIGGRENQYSCDFSSCLMTPELFSLQFVFYNYECGAHGATSYVPLNFQLLPQPKVLRLSDIFNRPIKYNQLSKFYRDRLNKQGISKL